MKQLMIIGLVLMGLILVLPTILVLGFNKEEASQIDMESPNESDPDVEEVWIDETVVENQETVAVFRTEAEAVEHVPFEEYIVGVVAREMPASYELEALKAQALTARTYLIQLMTMGNLEIPHGADITDTESHQVYASAEELQEEWGSDYEWRIARIQEAVKATEGMIITYDGAPIDALYFSTSNGYTENSEEYYSYEFPYLRSVESPWDLESPRYYNEVTMSVAEFEEKLGINVAETGLGEIVGRTTGGNVAKVAFGDVEYTGRQVREEKLGRDIIASSDFTWERRGDTIHIETRGWGHGVGMSQFGANGMAQEGHDFRDIIHHYYQGVEITEANQVMRSLMASG
ncbi:MULTISPECIES: stage II sporulation protein D [Bacillaceae]|uniref:Stage II sporulation protein D n=1 Tax=Evansella alkalicola TaxID=745819 RepID=A0ABS6JXT6_9BACI|nr:MULTISPECIES: stage II sporulation protein D [Bacillaceae]MBU9723414.1 stage II sporulation protein D [Bacillus alkalicola]